MRIGIIGSGRIGGTLARLLTEAGDQVMLANSRGPQTLAETVAELGPDASAGTVADAARYGDVVIVAIPFGRYGELPAEAFRGKTVIDTTNYYPERDDHIDSLDSGRDTSSRLIANYLEGANVVKAFNTIYFVHLGTQGRPGAGEARRAIFVAGDDGDAVRQVCELVDRLGFAPVVTGRLTEGGQLQEPGTRLYNVDLDERQARELLASP